MSDVPSLKLGLLFSALSALAACAPAAEADGADLATSESALGEAATITFDAAFGERLAGSLQKGKRVRITYDASRLTACRGEMYGKPAWSITGYYRLGGGDVRSFEAGGLSPSGGASAPTLALDRAGDLEIWFQNTSRWGCSAFDSDFGRNYHFTVKPSASEPGWVGNPRFVTARQTCGYGDACEGDLRPVEGEILYDTWVRQRAAIRELTFEVWKEGVTDRDNPDLWKQLDVQVHARVAETGPWTAAYVSFDRRLGNNARYALDLGALDPLQGVAGIQDASQCPAFPLAKSGGYVEAVVDLYFTVSGVELRPEGGGAFRVRYQNYASSFAPCVGP